MSIREIPAADWQEFLDDFSRSHRAWRATVDRRDSGLARDDERIERPLESVTPEVSANRVVNIEIRFQQEDARSARALRIDAPTNVRVDETGLGTVQALEIIDEHGGCTRLRFRAAPLPEMLDGVAPGELPEA